MKRGSRKSANKGESNDALEKSFSKKWQAQV